MVKTNKIVMVDKKHTKEERLKLKAIKKSIKNKKDIQKKISYPFLNEVVNYSEAV